MTIKTKAFDASKYIKSREAEAALWADAVESGHAGVMASALGTIAKARGISQLAKETGLSRQALYTGLSDDGNPTLDTVLKVTKALGLSLSAARGDEGGHADIGPTFAALRGDLGRDFFASPLVENATFLNVAPSYVQAGGGHLIVDTDMVAVGHITRSTTTSGQKRKRRSATAEVE